MQCSELLEAFRSYGGNVENLLPATVSSDDSYDRFVTIMHRINQHLYPAFTPEGLIKLYALVVVEWLKGYSLASMIRRSINWHLKAKRKFKLPQLIRQTMEFVEQIARFRAPKYFSAYVDVLHLHLKETGRQDLVQLRSGYRNPARVWSFDNHTFLTHGVGVVPHNRSGSLREDCAG